MCFEAHSLVSKGKVLLSKVFMVNVFVNQGLKRRFDIRLHTIAQGTRGVIKKIGY